MGKSGLPTLLGKVCSCDVAFFVIICKLSCIIKRDVGNYKLLVIFYSIMVLKMFSYQPCDYGLVLLRRYFLFHLKIRRKNSNLVDVSLIRFSLPTIWGEKSNVLAFSLHKNSEKILYLVHDVCIHTWTWQNLHSLEGPELLSLSSNASSFMSKLPNTISKKAKQIFPRMAVYYRTHAIAKDVLLYVLSNNSFL